MVQMTPVHSSHLAAVGYDASVQELYVEFRDGGLYRYFNVPASIYAGLMNAHSHGKYFDQYVRKGGYRYVKIR